MIIKMILTNAFDPDPRVYKEAKTLINAGHDVEILCWDRDNRYTDKDSEIYGDIKIKRFYFKSIYGSGFKQIYSYCRFIMQIKQYLEKQEYDFVHAHDIDGAFAGIFVKKNSKLIWDMHELYDGFNYGYIKKNIYEILAKHCFNKANGIIYVSDSQKERYRNKKKNDTIDAIVMNAPEEKVFNGLKRNLSNKLRISFIGSVREYDTLKYLMDIGEKFNNVAININGMGIAYYNLKKIEHKYKNTIVSGKFSYEDIKKYYENTDIIYAVYDSNLVNVKYAFPVKGLEAVATETPIITNKNTHFGDFVEKHDIGFTINENSSTELESLVKSILSNNKLLKKKTENITKIKNRFKWNEQSENLIQLYKELTYRRPNEL